MSETRTVQLFGVFFRSSDGEQIQRFKCKRCQRSFSDATFDARYRQLKRQYNLLVYRNLSSTNSQRRIALNTGLSRTTVKRKFLFMAEQCQIENEAANHQRVPASVIEFDELETCIQTKCKRLSVAMAVEQSSRWILGFSVAQMPAKGQLAALARARFGPQTDKRAEGRDKLFMQIEPLVTKNAIFKTDKCPQYPSAIKKHFPSSRHLAFKGGKKSFNGLGEIKEATIRSFRLTTRSPCCVQISIDC